MKTKQALFRQRKRKRPGRGHRCERSKKYKLEGTQANCRVSLRSGQVVLGFLCFLGCGEGVVSKLWGLNCDSAFWLGGTLFLTGWRLSPWAPLLFVVSAFIMMMV